MDADAIWTELESGHPASPGIVRRRIVPGSARNLFLGVAQPSGSRLFILAVHASALTGVVDLPVTRAVRTAAIDVGDDHTEVRVELEAAEASDVFTPFVQDVAACVAATATDAEAVAALSQRFGYWSRLLSGELAEGLGADAAQGLWGELWVMRHILHPVWGDEAVSSWTGPDRDDNDFRRGSRAIEVKTMRGAHPEVVRITSERQLDNPLGTALFLVALSVDRHRHGAGESLPEMIAGCRDIIDDGYQGQLEDRLLAWGYSEAHRNNYEGTRYTIRSSSAFQVAGGFPRIIESALPVGVGSVSYRLALDACRSFELDVSTELRAGLMEELT